VFRTAAATRLKLVSLVEVNSGPDAALDVPDHQCTVASHADQLWTGRTDALVTDSELTLMTAAVWPLTFTQEFTRFTFHARLHQPINWSIDPSLSLCSHRHHYESGTVRVLVYDSVCIPMAAVHIHTSRPLWVICKFHSYEQFLHRLCFYPTCAKLTTRK